MIKVPQVYYPEFLLGLGSHDLEEFAEDEGEKAFRGRQIHEWIYQKGAKNLEEITSRMKGWQLETFKESYKYKLKNGISLVKKKLQEKN